MCRKAVSLAVGLLVALVGGSALAQEHGGYLGVGAGQSKAVDPPPSCSDLAVLFNPGYSCSINDTDTGWKIFAGYQFNPNFALELSYLDLGKPKLTANGVLGGAPISLKQTLHTTGFSIDGVLSVPLSKEFALMARVGLFAWSVDAKATATNNNTGVTANASDKPSGTTLNYGLGAKYDFSGSVGLRVEYQRFTNLGDENTIGPLFNVDLLSASLVYRFR
jgi:OmpA-OmpF porin, OOP family